MRWDSRGPSSAAPDGRPRSDDLYHTARWFRLSRAVRAEQPLCEECRRRGILRPSTCVDHIVPMPICRDYFFDRANLQALCDECNRAKGNRDKKLIAEWKLKH